MINKGFFFFGTFARLLLNDYSACFKVILPLGFVNDIALVNTPLYVECPSFSKNFTQ